MDYRHLSVYLVAIIVCFAITEKFVSFVVRFSEQHEHGDKISVVLLEGRGEIRAASYYNTRVKDHGHPIDISLEPKEGDVDLYVSDRPSPTWHLENHNISSYSCGTEIITVPKVFTRPFYVAVYCYNIYDNCSFYLTISSQQSVSAATETAEKDYHSYTKDSKDHESASTQRKLKSSFLRFIDILFQSLASFA